jgi:hypothetical protein
LRVERDCGLSVCGGQLNPTDSSMPFEPVVHKALLRKGSTNVRVAQVNTHNLQ